MKDYCEEFGLTEAYKKACELYELDKQEQLELDEFEMNEE